MLATRVRIGRPHPARAAERTSVAKRRVHNKHSSAKNVLRTRAFSFASLVCWTALSTIADHSHQHIMHNFAVDIRQAEVAALVAVGESRVVDAHEMQDRRVQIVNMHRFLDDVVTEVVRHTVRQALLHSGSGHQYGEAARMMVAAVVRVGHAALRIDRSTELAAPDDQRIIQQAALFQVSDQCGSSLIGVAALAFDRIRQAAVVIPAHVKQLHKPNITFSQSASQQAVGCV